MYLEERGERGRCDRTRGRKRLLDEAEERGKLRDEREAGGGGKGRRGEEKIRTMRGKNSGRKEGCDEGVYISMEVSGSL